MQQGQQPQNSRHLIQLMLFAVELERQIDENESLKETLEDYRQKAIDMEKHHTVELNEIKEFFEATVREQAVRLHSLSLVDKLQYRKSWKTFKEYTRKINLSGKGI